MTYYKRYLQWFFGVLGLLVIPCILNGLFLYRLGEFTAVQTLAKRQLQDQVLLTSTVTHDLTYLYKLALYQATQPDVVILGSSRVMPFRQQMFRGTFLNMSRAMNHVDQGLWLVEDLLKSHVPNVVFIALDYWWFISSTKQHYFYEHQPNDQAVLSFKLLMKPFMWLYQKKIHWSYYFSVILNGASPKYVGLNAQIKKEGFSKDGSYYHVGIPTGAFPSEDHQFQQSLSHIHQGKGFYAHHQKIDEKQIVKLKKLLHKLKETGVQTVVYIPPLAPTVFREMQQYQDEFSYIHKLADVLNEQEIPFYNFHDPSLISASDCEFFDGSHGGDINALKILKKIASESKNTNWVEHINFEYIENSLEQYEGNFMIPNALISAKTEVDFLHLGCQKGRKT